MSAITVREITPADQFEAAEVARLATLDLRKVYRPTEKALEQRAALGPGLLQLVAVLDGRVAGAVEYHTNGDRLSFLGLGVHPDFRLRGVATALVQRLETLARASGCRNLDLHTVRETGNVHVFERMGFVVTSESPSGLFESEVFPALSEVFMTKDVSGARKR